MSKSSCIETIKIQDGRPLNIEWHNQRYHRTLREYYGIDRNSNLQEFITNPPSDGVFRCRITYHHEIQSVEYLPYHAKKFQHFKLIHSDIDYTYKYSNRQALDQLKSQASSYDEIIIVKNNLLTDTSIANIAFWDQGVWITPKKPLLKGTMRAKLLKKGFLVKKNIKSESLKHFSHFALMNAMIGFEVQKNPTIDS